METLNFCTLFDSTYMSRGLAMYQSLKEHCDNFHLYIFAFNDICYTTLSSMNLTNATIISLSEFEDEELLRVKPTRTRAEYCWTCSSSTILYVLNHYNISHCTYLDSDLFFFSSPQPMIEEMGNKSVMITPHRYTTKYDQSKKTGIFCVQFVTFKNNKDGRIVLNWWRNSCLNWCYARFENNKFGDQKYLDDWPTRFDTSVYVSNNLGGGVAPWNMQQYKFTKESDGYIYGTEISTDNRFKVIFFHFHSLYFLSPKHFSPRPYYKRNDSVISLLFNPYIKELLKLREQYQPIKKNEQYLSGWNYIKYIIEVFIRRGFKEIHYNKLLYK